MLYHLAISSFEDPTELGTKLEGLLDSGATPIEGAILAELSKVMGEDLRHKDDPFVKCVLRARANYLKSTEKR